MAKEYIIGRQDEIRRLEQCMKETSAQLVILYGRRRIGKTYLITEFFDGRFDFKLTGAYNEKKEVQLRHFAEELSEHLKQEIETPPDWPAAFRLLQKYLSSLPKEFKNRWMQAGDEVRTNIPTIASLNQVDRYGSTTLSTAYNVYNYSTERVAKGDFIRLKELALTYTFPQQLLRKSHLINSASIKLAATNLCLLYADKKLNGQDPEFINSGGVATPISKQFTATVRLGF